jgi:uncharacterized protein YndB with AHSA1/START domain
MPTTETEPPATVTREIEIDAPVEDVWETLATEAGRERWLEEDPDRILIVESEEPPSRIAWWWWTEETAATHVEIDVVAIPAGSRVIVTETLPASFPMARMEGSLQPVLAAA